MLILAVWCRRVSLGCRTVSWGIKGCLGVNRLTAGRHVIVEMSQEIHPFS